jgi:hypothetical protein
MLKVMSLTSLFFITVVTNPFLVLFIKLFYVVVLCHAQPATYYLVCHIESLMKHSEEWKTEPSSTETA